MNISEIQSLIRHQDTIEVVRPLGAFEQLFWLIDHKTPQHFAVTAHFVGRSSARDWRAALDRAQNRHPLLAVCIQTRPGLPPYFSKAPGATIPMRVVEDEPQARWEQEVAAELAASFDPHGAPLVRAVLIQGVRDAAIMLVAHHAIADGLSLVYLMRDLFSLVAGDKLEPFAMRPSMHDLLSRVPGSLGRTTDRMKSLSPGLPSPLRPKDGARPTVRSARLAPDLLARLRERSRREGTTVQGALCAAVALAGRQLSDEWSERVLRLLSPISIRSYLGVGEEVGLFASGANIVYERNIADFWSAARLATSTLTQARSPQGVEAASLAMQAAAAAEASVASAAEFSATAFAREGMVTNLGNLPIATQYGDLRITALWGPAISSGPIGDQTVGAASLGGWMHLVHVSYTPIKGLLPVVQNLLVEACAT